MRRDCNCYEPGQRAYVSATGGEVHLGYETGLNPPSASDAAFIFTFLLRRGSPAVSSADQEAMGQEMLRGLPEGPPRNGQNNCGQTARAVTARRHVRPRRSDVPPRRTSRVSSKRRIQITILTRHHLSLERAGDRARTRADRLHGSLRSKESPN